MDSGTYENIELSLPVNAAYVSAARQTALSIAGRMGFDADEVEDVKTAVSEACTFIIKKMAGKDAGMFTLTFALKQDYIEVRLMCGAHGLLSGGEDDYSLLLIRGLMDGLEIADGSAFEMTMHKRHTESTFN